MTPPRLGLRENLPQFTLLVVLNAFLTLIAILATPVSRRTGSFVGLMLAMAGGLAGVFLATDLVLFYVFWEAMLIPAYFLLWQHGEGPRAGWAATPRSLHRAPHPHRTSHCSSPRPCRPAKSRLRPKLWPS